MSHNIQLWGSIVVITSCVVRTWMPWFLLILTTDTDIEGRTKSHKSMPIIQGDSITNWVSIQVQWKVLYLYVYFPILCVFSQSESVLGIQPPWHRLLSSFYSRGDKNNLLSFRIMKCPLALCYGRLHFHCFRGNWVKMAVVTTTIKKSDFWYKCGKCQILLS